MTNSRSLLFGLMLVISVSGISSTPRLSQTEPSTDRLQPLLFLVGSWHGVGKGPYGPYEFETIVERRGRWLLLTSNVFPPG